MASSLLPMDVIRFFNVSIALSLASIAGADKSECVRECARAIELDDDYGNPWNDVACELWDAGDTTLAARFFERAKLCSRYESGAGHFPYANLARLYLSECAQQASNGDSGSRSAARYVKGATFASDEGSSSRSASSKMYLPSREALLELCAALIRAPGDTELQEMVFRMIDDPEWLVRAFRH
ncbi:hypothetical protein CBR_g41000 [Chara braunii]|uniref:Uncharacterized protein n=1 Tax=Chara braunii TaxID=69332 RepID=A0A388LUV4_CHABU|nr:hypothetical protein CBR_g41000 [Chara braunii]|eukprot:GBG86098.1 hypothetical protein CBR_g41000 [Chara braunii]